MENKSSGEKEMERKFELATRKIKLCTKRDTLQNLVRQLNYDIAETDDIIAEVTAELSLLGEGQIVMAIDGN